MLEQSALIQVHRSQSSSSVFHVPVFVIIVYSMNYQDVLLAAIQKIPTQHIETELLKLFHDYRVFRYLNVLRFAETKHWLLHNYSQALSVAKKNERVSGFFRGSLGTMLTEDIKQNEAAEILNIDKRSIQRSLKQAQEKLQARIITGKHNKFVQRTCYSVSRLPVQPSVVTNWILDHCRASANSSNTVCQRDFNGNWTFNVMHYRDATIDELFTEYKVKSLIFQEMYPYFSTPGASKFYSLLFLFRRLARPNFIQFCYYFSTPCASKVQTLHSKVVNVSTRLSSRMVLALPHSILWCRSVCICNGTIQGCAQLALQHTIGIEC